MRSAQQWFDEYAISHQHETNKIIHYICVPAIFFTIVGMLMCIPSGLLQGLISLDNPLIVSWATVCGIVVLILFYLRLGVKYFLEMLIVFIISIIGNYYIGQQVDLLYFSIIVFVLAWIGQFYGHEVEGMKPSFFKDLQFLLIGPLWVIQKVIK